MSDERKNKKTIKMLNLDLMYLYDSKSHDDQHCIAKNTLKHLLQFRLASLLEEPNIAKV